MNNVVLESRTSLCLELNLVPAGLMVPGPFTISNLGCLQLAIGTCQNLVKMPVLYAESGLGDNSLNGMCQILTRKL